MPHAACIEKAGNHRGQGAAAAGRGDPLLIQWGPFVVFAAIILWLYWRIAYIPGGQPIGALEKFADTIGKRLRSLFGRRAAPRPA